MKFARLAAVSSVLILGAARPGLAQPGCLGARCTVEITMPITDVLRLSFNASSVALGTPTESDYGAGFRDASGVLQISAKSNRAFAVTVGGVATTFSYTGSLPNPLKPASDLRWATSAAALPATLNHMGTNTTLLSQGAGTASTSIYLRTLWNFTTDVPGLYSLGLSFTISAP